MDNQNAVTNVVEKKSSAGKAIAVISIILAAVGGLGFGISYFVVPFFTTVIALVTPVLAVLFYVPIVNLIPLGLLGLWSFITTWMLYISVALVVSAVVLGVVDLLFVAKKAGKGLAVAATIISGIVLLLVVLVSLVDMILAFLGLSVLFGGIGVIYFLLLLAMA